MHNDEYPTALTWTSSCHFCQIFIIQTNLYVQSTAYLKETKDLCSYRQKESLKLSTAGASIERTKVCQARLNRHSNIQWNFCSYVLLSENIINTNVSVLIQQKSRRQSNVSAKTLIKECVANSFARTFKNQWKSFVLMFFCL